MTHWQGFRRRALAALDRMTRVAVAFALSSAMLVTSPAFPVLGTTVAAKDAQRFEKVVDGAKATVIRSASLGKAVLIADNMPAAPEGKDFQLWLQQGDHMVSAGLMPHGHADTVTVLLDGDAATATAAGITLEPAGGSQEPTTAPVALFAFS